MESGLLRARRATGPGRPEDGKGDLVRAGVADGVARVEGWCRQILAAAGAGETLRGQLGAVHRLLGDVPPDGIALRRRIAERLLDAGTYVA
jgi:hypothetical protein